MWNVTPLQVYKLGILSCICRNFYPNKLYLIFIEINLMDIAKKFKNKLKCICNGDVIFEIIDNIECDWGNHIVIQCPNCEELFSVDKKCPAFQSIEKLLKNNDTLFSKTEQSDYILNSHPN